MDLEEQAASIDTKSDFVRFVALLAEDARNNPESWENVDLVAFLNAMGRWTASSENFYRNTGRVPPEQPTWRTFAETLLAARIYE